MPVSSNGDCRGSEMAGGSPTGLSVIWSLAGKAGACSRGVWAARGLCAGECCKAVDPLLLGCNFSQLATMRATGGTWLNSR